jgi:hypothetical protein
MIAIVFGMDIESDVSLNLLYVLVSFLGGFDQQLHLESTGQG